MDRERFIARIAERLGEDRYEAGAAPVAPRPTEVGGLSESPNVLAQTFCSRLAELGGTAELVPCRRAAQDAVGALLRERGWSSVACPPELTWPEVAGLRVSDPRVADFGLSEADYGIAETGTVVLCHRGDRGRAFSLVPPAIGCFLPLSRLRRHLGEVLPALPHTAGPPSHGPSPGGPSSGGPSSLPACVTFLSGPSHSGDIAGIFVTGVHGPGVVHVWLIADE